MDGFQHLPSQQQQRCWVYTGASGSTAFQTWNKPPGVSFVHIVCVGAGGGGGGGYGYYIAGAGNIFGAAGGAHGTMTTTFLPAYNVPDTLYILPGSGGRGGGGGRSGSLAAAASAAGTAGGSSYVSYYPNTGAGYTLAVATGGGGGPQAQTGNGGSIGGAVAVSTNYPTSQIGLRNSVNQTTILQSAGHTAAMYRVVAGGFGMGTSLTAPFSGSGQGVFPAGEMAFQSASSGISQGAPGNPGTSDWQKFIFNGGMSGYHSITQNGGLAGDGAYGCGGGGGAYGNPTGSNGGRGGDGFVIITCG